MRRDRRRPLPQRRISRQQNEASQAYYHPLYVDAAMRRWQAYTGRDAILKSTDQALDEVTARRNNLGGAR